MDVEAIAKGLTEAQRVAILELSLDALPDDEWEALCKTGATWFRSAFIDYEGDGECRPAARELRQKGMAVRNHLKGQQ